MNRKREGLAQFQEYIMTQASQLNAVSSVVVPRPHRSPNQYSGGHLTARGRRVLALVALIPMVAGLVLSGSRQASASGTAPTSRTIVVHAGESLWEIAVATDPSADPRKTMWEIQQLNHMATSNLVSGQALQVPVR
jgi:hypothetical protein